MIPSQVRICVNRPFGPFLRPFFKVFCTSRAYGDSGKKSKISDCSLGAKWDDKWPFLRPNSDFGQKYRLFFNTFLKKEHGKDPIWENTPIFGLFFSSKIHAMTIWDIPKF